MLTRNSGLIRENQTCVLQVRDSFGNVCLYEKPTWIDCLYICMYIPSYQRKVSLKVYEVLVKIKKLKIQHYITIIHCILFN